MNTSGVQSVRTEFLKLQVRPLLLLTCSAAILVILLPGEVRGHRTAQWLILIFANSAILLGWFFYLTDREWNSKWRKFVALATGLYLIASIPAFFFEFSPVKWFMRNHQWSSLYVRPWVHWGFVLVYLGCVGSFFGRGRGRIAFAVASVLLIILWESMARWIF